MKRILFALAALCCLCARSEAQGRFTDEFNSLTVLKMSSDDNVLLVRRHNRSQQHSEVGVVMDGVFKMPQVPDNRRNSHRTIYCQDLADTGTVICTLDGKNDHPDLPYEWHPKTGDLKALPLPESTDGVAVSGSAQKISQDGTVASGYCTQEGHYIKCLWLLQKDGSWRFRELKTEPSHLASKLHINGLSPNGRFVAGWVSTEISDITMKAVVMDLTDNVVTVIPTSQRAEANAVNDEGNAAVMVGGAVALWLKKKNDLVDMTQCVSSTVEAIHVDNTIVGHSILKGQRHGTIWKEGKDVTFLLDVSEIHCILNGRIGGYTVEPTSLVQTMLLMPIP